MNKTIILGNWKAKDTKEYLSNPQEVWFLKDLKTNKYYSLFGIDPNSFDKKMVKNTEYIYMGKDFLGYPMFDENFKPNNSEFSDEQKKIKFKRRFKFVSIFDYVKHLKKMRKNDKE